MDTARIKIYSKNGSHTQCRALLDTASTANFITDELATKLPLQKRYRPVPVRTLNSMHTTCDYYTRTTIESNHTTLRKTLNFFITKSISALTPNHTINRANVVIPPNIKLDDPDFHQVTLIQMLIGAGPTLSLLSVGKIRLPTASNDLDLVLQKNQLGWLSAEAYQITKSFKNQATQHIISK